MVMVAPPMTENQGYQGTRDAVSVEQPRLFDGAVPVYFQLTSRLHAATCDYSRYLPANVKRLTCSLIAAEQPPVFTILQLSRVACT